MNFIIQKIKGKLSTNKKLPAISYKLKAVLSVFKNLQPTTYPPERLNVCRSVGRGNLLPDSGFTLVETLVAISILMVAVASPLTITQKGLASAIYAKDQIIASYLAQDAIEYLRNVSDRNAATGANWLTGANGGFDIKTPCGTSCKADTRQNSGGISTCGGTCAVLNYDKSDNIYNYDTVAGDNQLSSFTRTITLTDGPGTDEALIKVTISWTAKNTPRSLDFYTRIYNWR